MIAVDSLLYKIDLKLNKLSSNDHQAIQLEDKILALNEAQIDLIKQKVYKKTRDDIQNLILNYDHQPLELQKKDERINQYYASLASLTPQYLAYLDSYILADKGKCKDRIIWINRDISLRGDLQFALNNEHYKPSFEYQETLNEIYGDEILIYTDGTFTPSKVYVSYIKYPLYIDKEGYVKLDGSDSITQDCELKPYLEDELLDLTVLHLAEYTENTSAAQGAIQRIQTN